MRLRDGDILAHTLWWKKFVWQAGRGTEICIPVSLLRRHTITANYVITLGLALMDAMGTHWRKSALSRYSKGVLTRAVAKGLEVNTLRDLAELLRDGFTVSGIGTTTRSDITRVISDTITRAAPRPVL